MSEPLEYPDADLVPTVSDAVHAYLRSAHPGKLSLDCGQVPNLWSCRSDSNAVSTTGDASFHCRGDGRYPTVV